MQGLLDLIAGLILMVAAAALSQFGLDLKAPLQPQSEPRPEIHRTADCPDEARPAAAIQAVSRAA